MSKFASNGQSQILDDQGDIINPATGENQTNGSHKTQIVDPGGMPAEIDNSTHTLQTIEYEHHEIHSGSHFFITSVQDLTINEVIDFTFTTPNTTKWAHLLWKMVTESEAAWYIYEGAAITNALANAITPLNSNRNIITASDILSRYEIQANLTAANTDINLSSATLLKSGIIGAGKLGGAEERDNELVLKQGTIYCLRVIASVAGYINFDMEWYEHTNKA